MNNRIDGRRNNELRPMNFQLGFQVHPDGSVLFSCGKTRVLCSVTISSGVPSWKREQGVVGGWLTAEYRMLPGSTTPRQGRKENGRSTEIQRLIGRTLRSIVDMEKLGNYTVTVDCDVIDADGGTRCASINGGYVALAIAFNKALKDGRLTNNPLVDQIAAISVGKVNGELLLDLNYPEDSAADVDMNLVMVNSGEYSEVQSSGEEATFSRKELNGLLDLAEEGLKVIFLEQKKAINEMDK